MFSSPARQTSHWPHPIQGIDQRNIADLDAAFVLFLRIRPERQHLADGLVPPSSAAATRRDPSATALAAMAEIVAALPDMQVAVTDAGGLHLDQHLGSRRLRRRRIDLRAGR